MGAARFIGAAALVAAAARALILLGPPASHYGYYDAMRGELYDFAATFRAAANATYGEPVHAIADAAGRRALAARGVGENDARLPGQWPPSVYEAKEYAMAWHPPNVGVPRFYVEQLRRVVREWRAEQRASAQGLTSCESGTPPNGILDIEGDEDDDDPPYSEGAPAALDMTKLSA